MDILEKLEELRDLNTRLANVDYDTLLELNAKAAEEMRAKEEEEDEQLVQSIFGNQNIQRRLEDVSDDDEEEGEQKSTGKIEKRKATDILAEDVSNTSQPAQKKQKTLSNVGIGKLKNKSLLSSLVKVNKDKAKEQKVPGKAAVKPGTACSEQKDVIQNSHKDTVKIDDVNKAGTNGSSLGLLGNYSSSSEDSDH